MSDDERVIAPCRECQQPVAVYPSTVRRGLVSCDACWEAERRRGAVIQAYLERARPRPSQRTVNTLARGFRGRGGLPGLLAASDADVLAVQMVGPALLRELRACVPAPIRPAARPDWAEHAAMIALVEEPEP